MRQYLDLLRHVLEAGQEKGDRTGTGTKSVFGHQMRFDLRKNFPLLTTKKLHTKSIIYELLWFLSGDTNVKYLQDNGVTIWNEWATAEQCAKFGRKEGELGPVYGHQWRNFGATRKADGTYEKNGIDQIKNLVDGIRKNPNGRRHIVSGWNPAEADLVALPPCHTLFQFYVNNGELSCQLYQRSADIFLGVPFNIASYAMLTHMIAQACSLKVGDFVHTLGDAHLYSNHLEQAKLQLSRDTRPLPTFTLVPRPSIFEHQFEDFVFTGYDPHPGIKAPIAI